MERLGGGALLILLLLEMTGNYIVVRALALHLSKSL